MDEQYAVERPLITLLTKDLEASADEKWDDPAGLVEVLSELLFRSRVAAVRLRGNVVERLVELSADSFLWPSTAALEGTGELGEASWPQQGLLARMGYHVGQSGVGDDDRREILDYVYLNPVPSVNSSSYMDDWGAPRSGMRLLKMADSIASFCRNAKRRAAAGMDLAIHEWEGDLDYLHDRYYVGRYDFIWPSTT